MPSVGLMTKFQFLSPNQRTSSFALTLTYIGTTEVLTYFGQKNGKREHAENKLGIKFHTGDFILNHLKVAFTSYMRGPVLLLVFSRTNCLTVATSCYIAMNHSPNKVPSLRFRH